MGRILATEYDEIVLQKLYPGRRQLEKNAVPLVLSASQQLGLSPAERQRTIVRLDAGAGSDANIGILLAAGFQLLTKFHHAGRCRKLANSVGAWYPDPLGWDREFGLVTQPIAYDRPTTQVAVRYRNKRGAFAYHVLLSTLSLPALHQLTNCLTDPNEAVWTLPYLILRAYDRRSGGIESAFKADKQALGIHRRNKRCFQAQEILLLLAQLAHNILTWFALPLRQLSTWRSLGHFRLIRDFFHISGFVYGTPIQVYLNPLHPNTVLWQAHAHGYLQVFEMYFYLHKN